MVPTFSIVVPTFRRPRRLAGCLAAIARLDYPRDRFETIVVDDGGDVALDAALEGTGDERVTLERQPHAGPAHARNRGALLARGRYVAFTDDDCEPDPSWLRALHAALSSGAAAAVGRSTSAVPGNAFSTVDELVTEFLFRHYNRGPDEARFGTSNNLAVDRATFLALGGFDETFQRAGGEDRELVHRLRASGCRVMWYPDATVRHFPSRNLRQFCIKHYRYGRGAAQFRRRAGAVQRESFSFYAQLVRYPTEAGERRTGLRALAALSQAATAAGFARESLLPARPP